MIELIPPHASSPDPAPAVHEWLTPRMDGPPRDAGMYMIQVDYPDGRTRYLARVLVTPALPAAARALAERVAASPGIIGSTPGVEDFRHVPVQPPLPVLKCDGGWTRYPPGEAPHDAAAVRGEVDHAS